MSISRHAGNISGAKVVSPESMTGTILSMGMVPFFENPIAGWSIEEMTPSQYWFDAPDGEIVNTPWDWKIYCVQSGEIAYGKFLWGGKAAFATVEWYRELRNWRLSLDKYQPDAAGQKILDYIEEHGSIGIKEVRALLGIKKGQADALMTRLQMGCRVVTGDIIRVYRGADLHYNGWQQSSFCKPEDLFGAPIVFPGFKGASVPESAGLEVSHSPEESYRRLSEKVLSLYPSATEKQISKLLG